MINLEVNIGRGIEPILFGWSESEVVGRLGSPDKARTVDQGEDDEERHLVYHHLRCGFWFRDDRLHWIRCGHPDLLVCGRKIHGSTSYEALEFLKAQLSGAIDSEDYVEWESHTFEESWLELQFEYDSLKEVCFGYLFGEDDEPIWPAPSRDVATD